MHLNRETRWTAVRPSFLVASACLLCTGVLALTSAVSKSVTIDEYVYPTGLVVLRSGSFHIDRQSAPLPRAAAAVPLLFADAKLDLDAAMTYDSGWTCGNRFARANESRYHALFFRGRLVAILVLLATCLLAAGYARSLYGRGAMLLALALAGLDPTLIAHGRLVMPDIFLTAAVIASLWALDRFLRRPAAGAAIALGGSLGLAVLSKFTGVLLFPIVVLVVGVLWTARRMGRGAVAEEAGAWGGRFWGWLALVFVCAVVVINAGYLFSGTLTPLGQYAFATGPFRLLQRVLPAGLPVPLPGAFLTGMDAQLGERGYQTYLLGELRTGGFPHFYVVALLAKLPLVTLGLAAFALLRRPRPSWRETVYLVPACCLFIFFSVAGHKNGGIRYVLFMIPLLGVWCSRVLAPSLQPRTGRGRRAVAALCVIAPVVLLGVTLRAWPHYLPYFNALWGGPERGHRVLLDSDLDFGQDLVALRRYMRVHDIRAVDLAYYGRVRPELYGIAYDHLFLGNRHRYAVISATLLWGKPYFVNGTAWWMPDKDLFMPFRRVPPVAVLGHTLYVFDLADPATAAAARELGRRRAAIFNP